MMRGMDCRVAMVVAILAVAAETMTFGVPVCRAGNDRYRRNESRRDLDQRLRRRDRKRVTKRDVRRLDREERLAFEKKRAEFRGRLEVIRKGGGKSALSQLESVAGSSVDAAGLVDLEDAAAKSPFITGTGEPLPLEKVAVPEVGLTEAQKVVCRRIADRSERLVTKMIETDERREALRNELSDAKVKAEEWRAKVARYDRMRVIRGRDVVHSMKAEAAREVADFERQIAELEREAAERDTTAKELRAEYESLKKQGDAVRKDPKLAETLR